LGWSPQSPWDHFAKALDVSENTIRRVAALMGLHKRICRKKPFLSEKSQAARQTWAAANVDQDSRRVIFTDECAIQIGKDITRHYTIRRAGEEYMPKHLQPTFKTGRTPLMVWGAVAYGKKWPLVRLPLSLQEVAADGLGKGNGLNSSRYIKYVLEGPLKRCVQAHKRARWRDVLVLEDEAPCPLCQVTCAAHQKLGTTPINQPPNSPHLNAMENLWHQLKLKLGRWIEGQQAWMNCGQKYSRHEMNWTFIWSSDWLTVWMRRRRDVAAARGGYARF
jgi:hypothetical protein